MNNKDRKRLVDIIDKYLTEKAHHITQEDIDTAVIYFTNHPELWELKDKEGVIG